jgi:hypothetical protein
MTARVAALRDKADELYRAAKECHRQHTRHARLAQKQASDDEQARALEAAYICDDDLASAMTAYETAKGHAESHGADQWWHKGNMLWHASRAFIRRHANCEGMAKRLGRQSPNRLAELTMSFDLEASALLALKMAADSYREARPEAE